MYKKNKRVHILYYIYIADADCLSNFILSALYILMMLYILECQKGGLNALVKADRPQQKSVAHLMAEV